MSLFLSNSTQVLPENKTDVKNVAIKINKMKKNVTDIQLKMENMWISCEELMDQRAKNLENQTERCFPTVKKTVRTVSQPTIEVQNSFECPVKIVPNRFEELHLKHKALNKDIKQLKTTFMEKFDHTTFSPSAIQKKILEQFSSED